MIAGRNFFSIIRRYTVVFSLNVIGLSVALAVAALVIMQMRYDFSFDSSQPDRKDIYLLTFDYRDVGCVGLAPYPAENVVEGFPGVASVCLMDPMYQSVFVRPEAGETTFKEKSCRVTGGFTDVFSFSFSESIPDPLAAENSVIVPESLARKMSPDGHALGMTLSVLSEGKATDYSVTGVYRDFPGNSSLSNALYFPVSDNYDSWGSLNYNLLMRLEKGTSPDAVAKMIADVTGNMEGYGLDRPGLVSLDGLHFRKGVIFDNFPKANFSTLLIFLAVAVLVTAVACINMSNFNTAIAPVRVKSINTMKILGSPRSRLCAGIISESVVTGILSWCLSVLLVLAASKTSVAGLIDPDISFSRQYQAFAVTFAVACISGLLYGIYPALYMTSFPPALALKGNLALSPRGRLMRSILVGFQYTVSFVLISCIGVILLQDRHLRNADMGFDAGSLMTVRIDGLLSEEQKEVFRSELAGIPGITGVSFSNTMLSENDNIPTWSRTLGGKDRYFNVVVVSDGFLETIGATIEEGRDFRKGDGMVWIFNESARRAFGLSLDDKIDGDQPIIGFVDDLRILSLRQAITPAGFLYYPVHDGSLINDEIAYIRTDGSADTRSLAKAVDEVLQKLSPGSPFETGTVSDVFESTYSKETKSTLLIGLFGAIAVMISLIGVSSLVMFDGETQRKSIAVRKVLGARTSDIVIGFNRAYMIILAVCFVVSVPLSVLFSGMWLRQFAERIAMPWWILAVVLLAMAAVTAVTVTAVCLRIAGAAPARNLKSE